MNLLICLVLRRSQFSVKADLPVRRSRIPKCRIASLWYIKKRVQPGFEPMPTFPGFPEQFALNNCLSYLHLFYSWVFVFKLILVIYISRHLPFIKVCRQSLKTLLLLLCIFFFKVCRQRRKTFLFLRSADKDLCVVLSFIYILIIFLFYFISFLLPAFCDIFAIFIRFFTHIWPVDRYIL